MPWHWEAMKVVASCEKFRGGASILWSGNYRIGKPSAVNLQELNTEYIGMSGKTRGIETSKYPEEKKTKVIP